MTKIRLLSLTLAVTALAGMAHAGDGDHRAERRLTRSCRPAANNSDRYVNCGDGTVLDTVTGLLWLRDSTCLGTGDWWTALARAALLAHGRCRLTDGSSPSDWRLPTKAEWDATIARAASLGCTEGRSPALTNDAGTECISVGPTSFLGVGSLGVDAHDFWTPNSDEDSLTHAFIGVTYYGRTDPFLKRLNAHIWPVRERRIDRPNAPRPHGQPAETQESR